MRVYKRIDMHEDLDEYEEEGEDLEDGDEYEEYEGEGGEEEEEVEEENAKPTKEELEYLELRQRLKEQARRKLRQESQSANGRSQQKKFPNDNFGSFFGPSQPAIARRVLEESRSILETQHIHAKTQNISSGSNKEHSSANVEGKIHVLRPPPKPVNELKMKVQQFKDTRNYSFLMSDDAEFPGTSKDHASAPRKVPVPNSDGRPAHVPTKSKASSISRPVKPVSSSHEGQVPMKSKASSMSRPMKPVPSSHEDRKSVSMSRPMQTKVGQSKADPKSRPEQAPADPRKSLGSNVGNGPGRPVGPKGPSPSASVLHVEKKKSLPVGAKSSTPANKASVSKSTTLQKHTIEQKKISQPADIPKVIQKPPVDRPRLKASIPSSKPQMKPPMKPQMKPVMKSQMKPPPKQASRQPVREDRPKKRPAHRYSDDEYEEDDQAAIQMIRNMFGYNPHKFRDDEDVSDMEAGFDTIMEEEKRSARIAREEDERELRLIEEDERREKIRKEAKKRKLSQQRR